MLRALLFFLAPGEKLPRGATQYSLGCEGLSWGWAFFAFVVLVAVTVWSYLRFAPNVSRGPRLGLIFLRSILLGLLLILLVKPILLITLEDTIRRPLLILLDTTQSMGIKDRRSDPDDLARAAIAKGVAAPRQRREANRFRFRRGWHQGHLAAGSTRSPRRESEDEPVAPAAGPRKLDVLRIRPEARTDRRTQAGPEQGDLTTDESAVFFHAIRYDDNLTAIGDGLRALLDEQRGQPTAGNSSHHRWLEQHRLFALGSAAIAKQDGVPLFIYGVGVTSPQDILVAELDAPQVSNVKEKLSVTVRIRAQSMIGRKATVQLKANGKVVDEQPIDFRADGEQEISLGYTPDEVGLADLEAYVPPLPEEAVKDNNSAKAQLRVVDDKLNVPACRGRAELGFPILGRHDAARSAYQGQMRTDEGRS